MSFVDSFSRMFTTPTVGPSRPAVEQRANSPSVSPIQNLYSAEMPGSSNIPLTPERSSTPLAAESSNASPLNESVEVPETPVSPELIRAFHELTTRLAATGYKLDIPLPQIVAIGDQSSGKSSVLESIVGREFLPRGTGLVTRRPTVVQLNNSTNGEYAMFQHTGDKKFTDFSEVRKEIQDVTNRSLAPGQFSSEPIILSIYLPDVLQLTIVDLPGYVLTPVDGQAAAISQVVEAVIMDYIREPQCIILAVTPANQDLGTSSALELARRVDPIRERTIGVLTKVDLMDQGTDALDILENEKIFLHKGYVAVKNRSQKDILEMRDLAYTLEREKEFFESHNIYGKIAFRCGIPYLRKLLHKSLRAHIKAFLPKILDNLSVKQINLEKSLEVLEENMGPRGGSSYAMRLVQIFVENITVSLTGNSELVSLDSVSPGAKIHFLLHTAIQNNLNLDLIPEGRKLAMAILNLAAMSTCIAIPTLTIESVCRSLLSSYKRPLEVSVECIRRQLSDAVEKTAASMNSYPSLRNNVIHRVHTCINRESDLTRQRLLSHIDAEMCTINMCHPDFNAALCEHLAPSASVVKIWEKSDKNVSASTTSNDSLGDSNVTSNDPEPQRPERKNPSKANTSRSGVSSSTESSPSAAPPLGSLEFEEMLNTGDIDTLVLQNDVIDKKVVFVTAMIKEYLKIVKKSIGDITIKYIAFFLVNKVLHFIKHTLLTDLLDSKKLDKLMEDGEDDVQKKAEMEAQLKCIKEALDKIQAF